MMPLTGKAMRLEVEMVVRERVRDGIHGIPMVGVVLATIGPAGWPFGTFVRSAQAGGPEPARMVGVFLVIVLVLFLIRGFFLVAPNEARVLQLFGDYAGTAKIPGLRWANPFFTRKKISLRVRNFESSKLKV